MTLNIIKDTSRLQSNESYIQDKYLQDRIMYSMNIHVCEYMSICVDKNKSFWQLTIVYILCNRTKTSLLIFLTSTEQLFSSSSFSRLYINICLNWMVIQQIICNMYIHLYSCIFVLRLFIEGLQEKIFQSMDGMGTWRLPGKHPTS